MPPIDAPTMVHARQAQRVHHTQGVGGHVGQV
jgi:hypothetical protein